MNYRSFWVVITAFLVSLSPLAPVFNGRVLADEGEAAPQEEDLMTEAQLADLLVNVLGLGALLPPNPQQADVFGILLQNGIVPADGWNPTNYVTIGNLARILVQAMGEQDQIENPDNDASWVEYLKSIGVEFGTIEEALAQAAPVKDPVALAAVETSTDPLRKVPLIRPADEQQLGADLQPFRSVISAADIIRILSEIEEPEPPQPEPTTPS